MVIVFLRARSRKRESIREWKDSSTTPVIAAKNSAKAEGNATISSTEKEGRGRKASL